MRLVGKDPFHQTLAVTESGGQLIKGVGVGGPAQIQTKSCCSTIGTGRVEVLLTRNMPVNLHVNTLTGLLKYYLKSRLLALSEFTSPSHVIPEDGKFEVS